MKFLVWFLLPFITACTLDVSVANLSSSAPTSETLSAPSSLTLQNPTTSPGNDTTPTIRVGSVVAGQTVSLYTDSTCSTQIATGTAAGNSIDLTLGALTDATYNFYANAADSLGNLSACSTATVQYVLDTVTSTAILNGQPTGTNNTEVLSVTVGGVGVTHYQFKVGLTVSTDCAVGTGYSSDIAVSTLITHDISAVSDGDITLCVIGKDTAGNYQTLASATTETWTKNTTVKMIYRSVGPGQTGSLVAAAGSGMTISSGVAVFETALPNNIGVGDAIQYNSSGSLVFIHGRTSNTYYSVRTALGAVPANVSSPDTSWSIFRAYTSLANAAAGTENTGIAIGVRDFDTWTNGRDLPVNNEQWNIAAYADATDTTAVAFDGAIWKTSSTNYLRIYTPFALNEVGATQRHSGVWTTSAYNLATSNFDSALKVEVNYSWVDGLQVSNSYNGDYVGVIGGGYGGAAATYFSNNISRFRGTGDYGGGIYVFGNGNVNSQAFFWNNIVFNDNAVSIGIFAFDVNTAHIHNNTISNVTSGVITYTNVPHAYVRNNIAVGISGYNYDSYSINVCDLCDYNISSTNLASGGPNDKISQTVNFVNGAGGDFNLNVSDTAAKNSGTNLSTDPYLPFTTNILGVIRSGVWNIGAF